MAIEQTDHKTGSWLERQVMGWSAHDINELQSARCSACGKYHTTPYMYYFNDFAYCPNCGVRMRSVSDAAL